MMSCVRAVAIASWVCLLAFGTSTSVADEQKARRYPPEQRKHEEPKGDRASSAQLSESARAERRLLRDPTSRADRIAAARAHLSEGADKPSHVDAAHQHALAVLEEAPSDIGALLLVGQTSLLKGDALTAARYYRAATHADQNNGTAFLGLGDALGRLGDETGASAAFARYRALMGMPPMEETITE